MNGYERTRAWYNFCFEHPDRIKPIHHAIYLYTVELCNRLGWKKKFGLPTDSTMEVLGIKNYRTFIKALNELIDWGLIVLIQKSTNQYTANVIALSKNTKATTKALDKAIQLQSQSTVSIDKQLNNETLNNKTLFNVSVSDVPVDLLEFYKLALKLQKVICKNLRDKNAPSLVQETANFYSCVTPIQKMMEQEKVTVRQIENGIYFLGSADGNFWKGIVLSAESFKEKLPQLLMAAKRNSKEKESLAPMNHSVQQKLEKYD